MTPHISTPYLWIPVLIILVWSLLVLTIYLVSYFGSLWLRSEPERHIRFQKVIRGCLRFLLVR